MSAAQRIQQQHPASGVRCKNANCNHVVFGNLLDYKVEPGGRIACPSCGEHLVRVTCPDCKHGMVKGRGRATGRPIWRCSQFPKCKRIGAG